MAKNKKKTEEQPLSKNKAIRRFHTDVNALAALVNEQIFENCRNYYWVGDEVGGLCDFDGGDFLTPTEMVLILENELTYDQYAEWRNAGLDYNADKEDSQQRYINLNSWICGARYEMFDKTTVLFGSPEVSVKADTEEARKRLSEAERSLFDAIDSTKF